MALYIDDVPYMRTVIGRRALPKGDPFKYGNLVFLYSKDIDESIKLINNTTIYNQNSFVYYYYNLLYRGTIRGKKYYIRDMDARKNAYDKIKSETSLMAHPLKPLGETQKSNTGKCKNTFFELSKYLSIFFEKTEKVPVITKIHLFWQWFTDTLMSENTSKFKKYMLISAASHPIGKGEIKNLIKNPLFMIYYTMRRYPELMSALDVDILIFGENKLMKVNLSKCANKNDKMYIPFLRELNKVMASVKSSVEIDDKAIDDAIDKEDLARKIINKYNFVGDNIQDNDSELENKIEEKIAEKVSDVTDMISSAPSAEDEEASLIDSENTQALAEQLVKDELAIDNDLINDIYTYNSKKKPARSAASTARDKMLREQQKKIQVANMTIDDLEKIKVSDIPIPVKDVSHALHTTNPNMKKVKFNNIDKEYNEKVLQKDITNAFLSLNDKSVPMQIIKYEIVDSSDNLNYKETHKVTLEDVNRVRHQITVDIPKFYENKFLYLGGNKKLINHQDFFYPIVKTGPATVQIVSNYMKLFIRRVDTKSIGDVEKFLTLAARNPEFNKLISFGNVHSYNIGRVSNLEYDELSRRISRFTYKDTVIYFKREDADNAYERKYGHPYKEGKNGEFFIGFKNNEPIIISPDKSNDICQMMLVTDEFRDEFNSIADRKRLMYTNATIMAQAIPLITLLALWVGLDEVLKKLGVHYEFSDKKSPNSSMTSIKLADGYLLYDSKNIEAQLLLNGLINMRPYQYTYAELNTQDPYIEYFTSVYGKSNIVNPLMTAYEFFIGPIELEVLQDLNLPTDILSLCLYANKLLCDNDYTPENSATIKRIRSNEIIPAILYATIAQHYTVFRNGGPKTKLSIPRDAVIKQLLALQTVEDYSTLNPIVELNKSRNVTSKGFRGTNLDKSYTFEKRQYSPSMLGVMAASSSPDANVGVMRDLTLEPTITSLRGYMDLKYEDPDKLKDVNLYSAAELAITMGATHDDSIRTAMASQQTKHMVPTVKSSPVLISNGADEVFRFNLSSDFVVNAEEDGKVVEYDEESQLMVVEYKSGKHRAIDLSNHIVKNGAGGFYLPNQLQTKLRVGDKFKQDDCLAYHTKFFSESKLNGTRMTIGPLAKVAIMSTFNTYEDSAGVTEKLAKDLSAELVFNDPAVVSMNSNVDFIAKVGDHVNIGDTLIQYDTGYDDSTELNKFLSALNDSQMDEINEISKNNIKAKHSGVIVDIKIYCTVETEQLSPSLQKIVKAYYSKINKKNKLLDKYDNSNPTVKCGVLLTEAAKKTEPNIYGVVKGQKVTDGVLFEFYISHVDTFGVGDKLVWFTALKGVCCEVIPEGFEPYSEYRPEEEVSGTISENAILGRMTPSIILTVLGNKMIVELKRHLEDIYLEPEN